MEAKKAKFTAAHRQNVTDLYSNTGGVSSHLKILAFLKFDFVETSRPVLTCANFMTRQIGGTEREGTVSNSVTHREKTGRDKRRTIGTCSTV